MTLPNRKWRKANKEEPIQEKILDFLTRNSNQAYSAKEIADQIEPDYSMQTQDAIAAVMYELALQSLAFESKIKMKKIGRGKNETNYYKIMA
jgi:Cdc6-like AAA superfamily ATPase